MRRKPQFFNVTVLLDLRNRTGRANLEGVFGFANRRNWNLRILNSPAELTPAVIREMEENHENSGLIFGDTLSNPATIEAFKGTHFPIASIGRRQVSLRHRPDTVCICAEERLLGSYGARHLLGLGSFATFAYVNHAARTFWSSERGRGFAETCAGRGHAAAVFAAESESDFRRLPKWLSALPKPAAIMASWDDCALKVITACREAHIAIPNDLVLLGVDDDELLCENSRPRLSSIRIDNRFGGYWAASALDRIFHGKPVPPAVSRICGVTERESTRAIPPALRIVRAGLAYIAEHAHEGIGVTDVAGHLGISISLANRRFRELKHTSIGEAIIQAKLAKVKKLLASCDWPINRIAVNCGFPNPNRLSHLFIERFGVSMSDYRRSARG